MDCERSTRLKMRLSVRAGVAQARRIPMRHREIIGSRGEWHIYCVCQKDKYMSKLFTGTQGKMNWEKWEPSSNMDIAIHV